MVRLFCWKEKKRKNINFAALTATTVTHVYNENTGVVAPIVQKFERGRESDIECGTTVPVQVPISVIRFFGRIFVIGIEFDINIDNCFERGDALSPPTQQ